MGWYVGFVGLGFVYGNFGLKWVIEERSFGVGYMLRYPMQPFNHSKFMQNLYHRLSKQTCLPGSMAADRPSSTRTNERFPGTGIAMFSAP